ncbi:MAG: leucyl/phenylalanyl-tRNA--protein transferase [Bacteroidetes bacterium HGW-Bacteroidetes-2]|nr:MAG: leucyl/phenylalanyl-tRNA--protein transferase [Bacteroidetes bacterium HGW-Bacteroidetes-2]
MPYFELSKDNNTFPPAYFADLDGLVAVGGDLKPERLLLAYNSGIYYWHYPLKHIKWWSPDPRTVLQLASYEISLERYPNLENKFSVGVTIHFERLLRTCQKFYNNKDKMDNNWLSERAFRTFMELHQKGFTLGVEVWKEDLLVGGLFGVVIGKIFFGEYAFSKKQVVKEIALLYLIKKLKEDKFILMDMQKESMLVPSFDYDELSRIEYVSICKENANNYNKLYKT